MYREFQYVSVIENLTSLFSNKDFVHVFDEFNGAKDNENELLTSAIQTTGRYHDNLFYQQPNAVLLQLFYDDMGTTNPLRGASAYYNMSVFYYTVRNLPAYFNSCFPNVHLLALCHSMDVKEFGFSLILDQFMRELHILETKGFTVNVNGQGSRHFFCTLYQVTGDNLALNALFGFTKSFTNDFFCIQLCYALKKDIQHLFREKDFIIRDKSSYEADLATSVETNACLKGANKDCLLNKSNHFHIMDNKTNDCMHSLLEGIVPFEICCVLHALIGEKLVCLDSLNNKLMILYSIR